MSVVYNSDILEDLLVVLQSQRRHGAVVSGFLNIDVDGALLLQSTLVFATELQLSPEFGTGSSLIAPAMIISRSDVGSWN